MWSAVVLVMVQPGRRSRQKGSSATTWSRSARHALVCMPPLSPLTVSVSHRVASVAQPEGRLEVKPRAVSPAHPIGPYRGVIISLESTLLTLCRNIIRVLTPTDTFGAQRTT
jgi:hypothetical protein